MDEQEFRRMLDLFPVVRSRDYRVIDLLLLLRFLPYTIDLLLLRFLPSTIDLPLPLLRFLPSTFSCITAPGALYWVSRG
jgi:hypothetical protein